MMRGKGSRIRGGRKGAGVW